MLSSVLSRAHLYCYVLLVLYTRVVLIASGNHGHGNDVRGAITMEAIYRDVRVEGSTNNKGSRNYCYNKTYESVAMSQ